MPKISDTHISFRGDSVHEVLKNHKDVVTEIWVLSQNMHDATITVHVNPRLTDIEPLVWSMNIASPVGRRSLAVTQRRAGGKVIFSNE